MTDDFKNHEIQESIQRINTLSRRYQKVCDQIPTVLETKRAFHILAMIESELAGEFWPSRYRFGELDPLSQLILSNLFS